MLGSIKSSSLHPRNMRHKDVLHKYGETEPERKTKSGIALRSWSDVLKKHPLWFHLLRPFLWGFVSAFLKGLETSAFFLTSIEKLTCCHWLLQVCLNIHKALVPLFLSLGTDKLEAERERTACTSANMGGCTVTGNHLRNSVKDFVS